MFSRLFLAVFLFGQAGVAQHGDLIKALKALPGVDSVYVIKTDSMFSAGFELRVRQPLDHKHPAGASFLQSVYVAHVDEERPTLLETEGYWAGQGQRPKELTRLLKCNQVVVEHRFFGKSRPDSLKWQYLTTQQAADDHHHIVNLLKTIYRGRWVSSGASKGGETALFYRYYYPGDVNATVAYVAPVNLGPEDPRILRFLRTVGTAEVREKLKKYQIALLKREKEILPLMDEIAQKRNMTFSIGTTTAYEYSVLEYPCGFWQNGRSPASIPPPDAPADSMLRPLLGSLYYYSDAGIKAFEPFQYQAYTEIGYYGYDITDFKGLLTQVTDPTNIILAPRNTPLEFNPVTMYNVYTWLRDHGNNIIYIYGENDLWNATAMELSGKTNAIKVVKKGGAHGTRIADLSPEQRELVYKVLEEWVGVKPGDRTSHH